MKNIAALLIFVLFVANVFAQKNSDLEKLVATEKSFAQAAADKGIRSAFLELLADDALVFNPNPANGKEVWRARPESPALLSWRPTFADISSNGVLGYTTGDYEYRPKGKDDNPTAFGQYMTIWRKQPDGNFKAVVDFGISHPKPERAETNWKSPAYAAKEVGENRPIAAKTVNLFYDTATDKGLSNAFKMFAAEDIRLLRDGKFPILGKENALAELKKDKSKISFGRRMTLQSAGDFAYALTNFEIIEGEKTTAKGNILQIWKLRDGKWQIVLDVSNSTLPEQK